ncbi:ATP-grasp domain-containing protein [Brevibacterium litoralis]|uniref:ATP-grasp domain-containing protein n=1 Tax=Brevibacterium litoralis TaxID=3138935 RepID=UPI0032EB663B
MAPRLTFLLGKPPKPGTLLAEVRDSLAARGASAPVLLPHQEPLDLDSLTGEDLVVHRGLHASVAPTLTAAHERGIPLCNPWSADALLRDRRSWHAALDRAGVTVPEAVTVDGWPEVLAHAGGEEAVVKALAGPGRGASVMAGTGATLPAQAPFPGPYQVEARLPAEDTDHKLYVAGEAVRGLRKPSTLTHAHVTTGTPFAPDTELTDLALEVGRVLGAHLLGVDVVRTPTGPVVVDVNAFPGFRGVADAPALVTAHLLDHARHG